MILYPATKKAVHYAVRNYHYSQKASARCFDVAFSVFNDKKEFCGVICYGRGANPKIASPYGLKQGEVLELLRVALNGKQESTSKAISISIKLLKKASPLTKILVSYADKGQNHIGIIYQATNWIFETESESSGYEYYKDGKWWHSKSLARFDRAKMEKRKMSGKYKYIYPLSKDMLLLCKERGKPYPKANIV